MHRRTIDRNMKHSHVSFSVHFHFYVLEVPARRHTAIVMFDINRFQLGSRRDILIGIRTWSKAYSSDVGIVELEDILVAFLEWILATLRFLQLIFGDLSLLAIESDEHLGISTG
jgi:hypothetical protein